MPVSKGKLNQFLNDVDRLATEMEQKDCKNWLELSDRLDKIFDDYLEKISSKLGFEVGRLVRWPVGDGYAWYVLLKIGKNTCELSHVPVGDAWSSPVVCRGKALTGAVKQAINWVDGFKVLAQRVYGQPKQKIK